MHNANGSLAVVPNGDDGSWDWHVFDFGQADARAAWVLDVAQTVWTPAPDGQRLFDGIFIDGYRGSGGWAAQLIPDANATTQAAWLAGVTAMGPQLATALPSLPGDGFVRLINPGAELDSFPGYNANSIEFFTPNAASIATLNASAAAHVFTEVHAYIGDNLGLFNLTLAAFLVAAGEGTYFVRAPVASPPTRRTPLSLPLYRPPPSPGRRQHMGHMRVVAHPALGVRRAARAARRPRHPRQWVGLAAHFRRRRHARLDRRWRLAAAVLARPSGRVGHREHGAVLLARLCERDDARLQRQLHDAVQFVVAHSRRSEPRALHWPPHHLPHAAGLQARAAGRRVRPLLLRHQLRRVCQRGLVRARGEPVMRAGADAVVVHPLGVGARDGRRVLAINTAWEDAAAVAAPAQGRLEAEPTWQQQQQQRQEMRESS